jgi:hypothetical protein
MDAAGTVRQAIAAETDLLGVARVDTPLTVPVAVYAVHSSFADVFTLGTFTVDTTNSRFQLADSDVQYLAVYDAAGGFVTGGGWIVSPQGAYALDPSLVGRATFGFVAKYEKGKTTPSGQTQFQFQVADLSFQSTSYDWLSVGGAKAQYKGTGMINGSGTYGFMLSAIDGQLSGGGGSDKFRIKIWNKATGVLVYDNQVSADKDENADPTTVISGGSIVIHK